MKYLICLCLLVACASQEKRTVSTDQCLRVAINTEFIPNIGEFQAIQAALLKSHKFIIVDRGPSMNMINKERQAQWGVTRSLFEPSSTAAMGGHILGAGAVITPSISCTHHWGFWGGTDKCISGLSLTSARTGELLAGVSKNGKPNWEKIVSEFIETYPEYFIYHKAQGTRLKEETEQIGKMESDWTPGEYMP